MHTIPDVSDVTKPETLDSDDDDLGYFDYIEVFQSRMGEAVATLDVIGAATAKVGDQIQLRVKEMYPGMDVKIVKKIVKIVAEDMNVYTEVLRNNLPLLTSARSAFMDALTSALALYDEFATGDKSGLDGTRSALANLSVAVSTSTTQVETFKSVVDALPRMSSDLNKAKRGLSGQLELVVVEFKNILQTNQNIISSIVRILNN
jgi:hypothetical protein